MLLTAQGPTNNEAHTAMHSLGPPFHAGTQCIAFRADAVEL
jgi:hypothetical protein